MFRYVFFFFGLLEKNCTRIYNKRKRNDEIRRVLPAHTPVFKRNETFFFRKFIAPTDDLSRESLKRPQKKEKIDFFFFINLVFSTTYDF